MIRCWMPCEQDTRRSRNWPEDEAGQIDTFRAGRLLWVSNYVAQFERQYLQEHLEFWAGPLERFLDTGKLRLG